MVINEFECELLRDEIDPLKRVDSWQLLFPEVTQDVRTTIATGSNKLSVPQHKQENIHEDDNNLFDINPATSIDATNNKVSSSPSNKRLGSHHKSFSLSSDSSSEEDVALFDIKLGKDKPTLTIQPPKLKDETSILHYSSNFDKLEEPDNNSSVVVDHHHHPIESSLVSSLTFKTTSVHPPSPMHNPPVQVMERDEEEYDPERIPSCVFARNDSLTPAEWSTASNESLFSLHVGNTSIGRDQAALLSGELKKLTGQSKSVDGFPGELKDELRRLAGLSKSGELVSFSPPPPTIPEGEHEGEIPEFKDSEEKIVAVVESEKENPLNTSPMKKIEQKQRQMLPSTCSSSISRQSDGSEESTCSFAFPIKKKKSVSRKKKCAWLSCCYCSNCSWVFCCHKRNCPSCCCWRPRWCCSNCSGAFCYGWNCSQKTCCCFSSSILCKTEKSATIKVQNHHQHSEKQFDAQKSLITSASVAPSSTSSGGGSCYSCCSCNSCGSCFSCRSCFSCVSCSHCRSCSCCSCKSCWRTCC